MFLKKLTDAVPGQEIEFVYDSGSKPGCLRRVRVLEVHPAGSALNQGWIKAEDMEDEDLPKNFSALYAREAEVVSPVEKPVTQRAVVNRISFVDVRQAVADKLDKLSSEQLATLYEQYVVANDEVDVEFDVETGDVVVSEPEIEPCFTFDPYRNLTIINSQKMGVALDIDPETAQVDLVYLDNDRKTVTFAEMNVTPERLLDVLLTHMEPTV